MSTALSQALLQNQRGYFIFIFSSPHRPFFKISFSNESAFHFLDIWTQIGAVRTFHAAYKPALACPVQPPHHFATGWPAVTARSFVSPVPASGSIWNIRNVARRIQRALAGKFLRIRIILKFIQAMIVVSLKVHCIRLWTAQTTT